MDFVHFLSSHMLDPALGGKALYRNVVTQARSPARQAGHEAFFREQLAGIEPPAPIAGLGGEPVDAFDLHSHSQAVELVHSASTPQTSGVEIRTNSSARWQPR